MESPGGINLGLAEIRRQPQPDSLTGCQTHPHCTCVSKWHVPSLRWHPNEPRLWVFMAYWNQNHQWVQAYLLVSQCKDVEGCASQSSKAGRKYCTSILSTFVFHLFSFLGVIFFIMNMIHYWDNSKHLIMLAMYLDIVQVLTYVNSFIYLFIEV